MNWPEAYDKYLVELAFQEQQERLQNCFHCSEVGHCQRKAVFRRSGIVLMPDVGRLRRLRQGKIVHNDYEQMVLNLNLGFEVEVDLTDYLPSGWVGHTDTLRIAPKNSELESVIADYKSMNAAAFRYRADLPKLADVLQLCCYWIAADNKATAENGKPVTQARLVYIPLGGMDDPAECDIPIAYKEESLRAMASLEQAWAAYKDVGTLPPPPVPEYKNGKWVQSWECNPAWCDYRAQDYCAGGSEQP